MRGGGSAIMSSCWSSQFTNRNTPQTYQLLGFRMGAQIDRSRFGGNRQKGLTYFYLTLTRHMAPGASAVEGLRARSRTVLYVWVVGGPCRGACEQTMMEPAARCGSAGWWLIQHSAIAVAGCLAID